MLNRKQSDLTRQKIAQKMKAIQAGRSENEKAAIRAKQSASMKQRWAETPQTTMDDLIGSDE